MPLHRDLRADLARVERRGVRILTGVRGLPLIAINQGDHSTPAMGVLAFRSQAAGEDYGVPMAAADPMRGQHLRNVLIIRILG
jgi:hypothetical protein